jgi:segregation and condensation protein A
VLSPEQLVGPVVYGQQVPEEVVPVVGAELDPVEAGGFQVRLANFEGPFDLLLQLIGKHKLDVTEVALHQVTDDFIAYIRAMGDEWDLGEASEFLLVAATLLDLKAARLLPAAEVEDEEDLALLEARDLLFARLLQYKAFKEAAAFISDLEGTGAKRWPRSVSMEARYAEALPDLVLGIGPERLFKLALKQFTPKPGPPEVSITHIHQMRVSVPEHAKLLRERLRRAGSATFSLLIADCENTLEVVARFLALLELYRQNLIDFEQPVSLDELTVRWIGGDGAADELDIDDYEGTRPDPDAPPAESVTEADLADGELVIDDDFDELDAGSGRALYGRSDGELDDEFDNGPDGELDGRSDGSLEAGSDGSLDGGWGGELGAGSGGEFDGRSDGELDGQLDTGSRSELDGGPDDELDADLRSELDGRSDGELDGRRDVGLGAGPDGEPVRDAPDEDDDRESEGEPAAVAGSDEIDAVSAGEAVVEEQP